MLYQQKSGQYHHSSSQSRLQEGFSQLAGKADLVGRIVEALEDGFHGIGGSDRSSGFGRQIYVAAQDKKPGQSDFPYKEKQN